MHRFILPGLLVGAAALAGGCYRSLNTSPTPAPGIVIDTLAPSEAKLRAPWGEPELVPPPSVISPERSNWGRTVVLVPAGTVNHHPTYTREWPRYTNESARQREEYPTAASCLDMPTSRTGQKEVGEALVAPFYGALDIVLFLPRAIVTSPWKTVQSPYESYARAPRREVVGGLEEVEPPEPVRAEPEGPGWPRRRGQAR